MFQRRVSRPGSPGWPSYPGSSSARTRPARGWLPSPPNAIRPGSSRPRSRPLRPAGASRSPRHLARRADVPGHNHRCSSPMLRIANCSGFYGDRVSAAKEMVDGGPIDVLTGDWLAELTMLLLGKAVLSGRPGYARTFLTQVEQVLPACLERG